MKNREKHKKQEVADFAARIVERIKLRAPSLGEDEDAIGIITLCISNEMLDINDDDGKPKANTRAFNFDDNGDPIETVVKSPPPYEPTFDSAAAVASIFSNDFSTLSVDSFFDDLEKEISTSKAVDSPGATPTAVAPVQPAAAPAVQPAPAAPVVATMQPTVAAKPAEAAPVAVAPPVVQATQAPTTPPPAATPIQTARVADASVLSVKTDIPLDDGEVAEVAEKVESPIDAYRKKTFGVWLKRIRKQRKLTLENVAILSGLSENSVFEVESGIRDCSTRKAKRIADGLGFEFEVEISEYIHD